MKNKLIVSASFVLLLSIAATVYAQVAQRTAPAAEVWEYAEIQLSESETAVPKLNAAGAKGWELVNVISACAGTYSSCQYYAYMKRRK